MLQFICVDTYFITDYGVFCGINAGLFKRNRIVYRPQHCGRWNHPTQVSSLQKGEECSDGGDSSALSGQTLLCSGIVFALESEVLGSNLGAGTDSAPGTTLSLNAATQIKGNFEFCQQNTEHPSGYLIHKKSYNTSRSFLLNDRKTKRPKTPQWSHLFVFSFCQIPHPNRSRLKVQKLRDQSQSSSVFLRGLYALGTECVRSSGTEWVRSGYGPGTELGGFPGRGGVKIALKGLRNLFRGVISLRKNFDFFSPPSSVPAPYFYPVT